jgi:hypothetical protein
MAARPNNTQDKTRDLQRKLYRAAERSPNRRFHALHEVRASPVRGPLPPWSLSRCHGDCCRRHGVGAVSAPSPLTPRTRRQPAPGNDIYLLQAADADTPGFLQQWW